MAAVWIEMMGGFELYIEGNRAEQIAVKSRKGAALMQYLIMCHGESVPNFKLFEMLWSDEQSTNPENALKTLVSRLRATLNQMYPNLGKCIVADRGAYHWDNFDIAQVDMFELERLMTATEATAHLTNENRAMFEKILQLYHGELLQGIDQGAYIISRAVSLHNRYMAGVYRYIEMLKEKEEYDEITRVARVALENDAFDERLHLELMNALTQSDRTNEALVQYKHVTNLHYRYLGVQPPAAVQELYKQIIKTGKTMEMNLDVIRNELKEYGDVRGAFVCDYTVFKEIYNLQMRNLERLGSSMFLGLIMISTVDGAVIEPMKLNDIMTGLQEILKSNLRKGDTISHFSTSQFALLLPTVSYETGKMVMERIKNIFYKRYPNSNVLFNYRIGPLSS